MENLYAYCKEKSLSPTAFAVLNMLVQFGDGLPLRYFEPDLTDCIKDVEAQGYVTIDNNRIKLTKKANDFIQTFIFLAKEEGEL